MSSITLSLLIVAFIAAASSNVIPPESRIIGGTNAIQGQIPYSVSIQTSNREHICGGAIINNRYILTVAQCTYNRQPNSVLLRVGSIYHAEGGVLHYAAQFRQHNEFNSNTRANDIATVQTTQPIVFNYQTSAISLPTFTQDVVITNAVVFGWGQTTVQGTPGKSGTLQFHYTNTITNAECLSKLAQIGWNNYVKITNVCALSNYAQGICTGDNGAPLTSNNQLIGLASFAKPCATSVPDVFTKVNQYLSWIQQNSY